MQARRLNWAIPFVGSVLLAIVALRSICAEKPETWVEVGTSHFTVMCNDGEKTARHIAEQFEQIRLLYSKALSRDLRLDPGVPIVILAAKDEKSFSQIVPEYWAEKGHTHPAGMFLPSAERNYIVLRTDVQGEIPYLTVYHEYVHLIVNLNFQHIPLWLNEGYATFLGSAMLLPKGGRLGLANPSELRVLSQSKLLPLDKLFRVGIDSPFYNEAEKTNVFYAESWALVHYLMTSEARQKGKDLSKYIALTEGGGDAVDSAQKAFGDLGLLKKELDAYASRSTFAMYVVSLPEAADFKFYPALAVPPAEVQATLGDFDVNRGQLEAARTRIEEALRLDPNLPASQEAMGLLLFREHKREEAQKYFSRAVSLDSKNALAYYFDGMLLVSGSAEEEDLDEARAALEKAVALRPELAPAWDALGSLYASDPATLDKALDASQHAVKALPGEPHYQFNLGIVLLRMKKYDEALGVADRIAKSADPAMAARARELLEQINQTQQAEARKREPPSFHPVAEIAATDNVAEGTSSTESAPANVNSGHDYSMLGTIATVNCAAAPEMEVTLQASTIVMHLHAADFSKVDLRQGSGSSLAENPSCGQLRGKTARISYQLVHGKTWDGEISAIHLQNLP